MIPTPVLPDNLSPLAQAILSRIVVLGILDTEQIRDIAPDRNQRDQTLDMLIDASVIEPLTLTRHLRAGRTGRPPRTFGVTEVGALVAEQFGHERAHAYRQANEANRAHDLCTLDVRLAAEAAGLKVRTERNLVDTPHVVRPDDTIVCPDGTLTLWEIEGTADAGQRARLMDKMLDWSRAADELKRRSADNRIRVLFNVKPGKPLDDTREMWMQVNADAQAALGQPLPLQFWGQPLAEFLSSPVWDRLEGFIRLDDPGHGLRFSPTAPTPAATVDPDQTIEDLSPFLQHAITNPDDVVRLRAHSRYFLRRLQADVPPFSTAFWELLREIYGAAFMAQGAEALSLPRVAWFMLRTYLRRYPDLLQSLRVRYQAMRRSDSISKTVHLATVYVHTFMDFHNLRHDHPDCRVWVNGPDFDGEHTRLTVSARLSLPLPPDVESRGTWQQVQLTTAEALAWVLQQLIDYAEVLDLDMPKKPRQMQAKQ